MDKLIIFGTRAFAEIADYYFTQDGDREVVAFTVDGAYLAESTFGGRPVVPFEEVADRFPPSDHEMFIAVGIAGVNRARAAKVAEAEAKGYRLASFVSSKADVAADLVIGPNAMVMERVGIQPFVTIGRDSIIWSASRIGFHSRVGDHCWITCPILGESVRIGDYSFVGLNATIAPGVAIGRSNVIGAGALIMADTDDDAVYRGQASRASRVPSHRIRRFRGR